MNTAITVSNTAAPAMPSRRVGKRVSHFLGFSKAWHARARTWQHQASASQARPTAHGSLSRQEPCALAGTRPLRPILCLLTGPAFLLCGNLVLQ